MHAADRQPQYDATEINGHLARSAGVGNGVNVQPDQCQQIRGRQREPKQPRGIVHIRRHIHRLHAHVVHEADAQRHGES